MNPYSKSKIVDDESSGEEIATEKISLAKAADAYSTLLTVAKSRPCYSAQGEMQLRVLHSAFFSKTKRMHQASRHSPGVPESLSSPTRISSLIERNGSDEAGWSVSIRGESSGIGWWYVKCRREVKN